MVALQRHWLQVMLTQKLQLTAKPVSQTPKDMSNQVSNAHSQSIRVTLKLRGLPLVMPVELVRGLLLNQMLRQTQHATIPQLLQTEPRGDAVLLSKRLKHVRIHALPIGTGLAQQHAAHLAQQHAHIPAIPLANQGTTASWRAMRTVAHHVPIITPTQQQRVRSTARAHSSLVPSHSSNQ